MEFWGKGCKMCFSTSTSAGAILIAVSFIRTLNLKGEAHMNLIYKIIAIATLALAASVADAPTSLVSDEPQLEESASKCCANYCGDDKECYTWCVKFGQNGPCPNSATE